MLQPKRQKLTDSNAGILPAYPTKYETSPATLKNFPSSVVSGATAEGGLYSLTFKSISYADYVEKSHLLRKAIIPQKEEAILVNDIVKLDEEYLKKLKEEVESYENSMAVDKQNDDEHQKLDQALQSKTPLGPIGKEIIADYEKNIGGKKLAFLKNDHVSFKVQTPSNVESIHDVTDLDTTAYQVESKKSEGGAQVADSDVVITSGILEESPGL